MRRSSDATEFLGRATAVVKTLAQLRYGGRKSAKFVRCYRKEEINAFRTEIELHPGVLDQFKIVAIQDLPKAAKAIYPKHVHFADIDWTKLRLYLTRREGKDGDAIFEGALNRAKSMRRVTQYLRRKRIPNVHRFLVPLAVNKKVKQALDTWAVQFQKEYERETTTAVDTKTRGARRWAGTN
jgi:hypothetical protein